MMVSASKGKNRVLIKSAFHLFVSSSIWEETIGKSSKTWGGEHTLYMDGVRSHLSSQICINFLLPTLP